MAAHSQINGQAGSRAEQVIHAARGLLDRRVTLLEGVRTLVALGYEPNGYDYAPGFEFFFWFNSVSAHLPGQENRGQCSQAFLEASDAEVGQLEERYGQRVDEACRALLDRFEKNA